MRLKKRVQALFLGLCFSGVVSAAPDIAVGKEKAGMCFSCHGVDGNSKNSNFPILAGQKPAYLVNQLRAFRDGTRENAMMQNMAANLTDQEINNLAAFFASVKSKSAGGDSELAEKGKSKAPMCFGCHGDKAIGMGLTPKLAGQYPAYLQRQLQAFKEGTRKNGPMSGIAKMLSDEDMKAVAEYMGSLK
ncbi:cytochrome C [Methyloprofundus sedimenti]|uniref:Cytochrome C n=1 Tax=Methyloprofundus sedimenti TaxID=1420851 RepID=A0A1V8M2Y5_9GAMM|nr:cytochrome c [Methyloprofundus sedimenti]OQK15846.1 cytochrome C [Methyloprofundus sedimenti]